MKDRISELLDKYWEGDTSLTEEMELRSLLKGNGDYPALSDFFTGFDQLAQIEPAMQRVKFHKLSALYFWKIAAVFIGILIVGSIFYSDYHKRAQKNAYLQVMDAFALIQDNMEKGTAELHVIGELRHLSKAHELFNLHEMPMRKNSHTGE
jgi:hypothetical protein